MYVCLRKRHNFFLNEYKFSYFFFKILNITITFMNYTDINLNILVCENDRKKHCFNNLFQINGIIQFYIIQFSIF